MTVSSHLCGEAEHYTARCILAIYKKAHIKNICPFTLYFEHFWAGTAVPVFRSTDVWFKESIALKL